MAWYTRYTFLWAKHLWIPTMIDDVFLQCWEHISYCTVQQKNMKYIWNTAWISHNIENLHLAYAIYNLTACQASPFVLPGWALPGYKCQKGNCLVTDDGVTFHYEVKWHPWGHSRSMWSVRNIGDPFYWLRLTGIRAWISNCTQCFVWDVISHPCSSLNGTWLKVDVRYGWVITYHNFM